MRERSAGVASSQRRRSCWLSKAAGARSAVVLADQLLGFRVELLEALPAPPDQLAPLLRQALPGLKAFTGLGPLFRIHAEPTLGAARQRALALGRQAVPVAE